MNQASAERWVTVSALTVAIVYAYRRITEGAQQGTLKNVLGIGTPVPLGQFMTAWGVTYLTVAIIASAAPPFGGGLAILIMASDLLGNIGDASGGLATDIGKGQAGKLAAATTVTPGKAGGLPTFQTPGFSQLTPTPPAGTELAP